MVPQDPNDEPASALLERIREARATQPKERKPRVVKPKKQQVNLGFEANTQTSSETQIVAGAGSVQAPLFPVGEADVKRLEDVPADHLTRTIKERRRDALALEAKALWQASDLSIDDFYVQLGREVGSGLLRINGDQPSLVEIA